MEIEDVNRLPIDRGWAWVILLAASLESFLIIGSMKSFGVFFVEFIRFYEASSSEISAVVSARTISISILEHYNFALFVLSAGAQCLANRWFVLIGCGFAFASYIVCAFAPDVDVVLLSQGIFWGSAVGLVHGPTLVMVGKYFNKKRGLANSLANIGAGAGGLAFPPLIRILIDFYGLQGTLILLSGIMLNVAIIAALLRPLEFYSRSRVSRKDAKAAKSLTDRDATTKEALLKDNGHLVNHEIKENLTMTKYITGENKGTMHLSYEILASDNTRRRTFSTNSAIERTIRTENEFGSSKYISKYLTTLSNRNLDLFRGSEEALAVGSLVDIQAIEDQPGNKRTCRGSFSNTLKKLFNFKVLKNKRFNLFMLTGFIAISGSAFVTLYLPPHAKDIGIDDTMAAVLVSIIQGSDILSRVCMAFILDKGILKRHHILSIALMITGVTCQLLPFFKEFWSLAIYAAVYGFFGGLYFAIYPVIIVDFVGIECLSSGMAIMMLMHGISLSSIAPLLGSLRDRTGSYLTSFHVMGSGSILAGLLLLLLEPLARRWQNRNDKLLKLRKQETNNDIMINCPDTKNGKS